MAAQRTFRQTALVLALALACVPALQAADSPIFFFPGMMVSNLTASNTVSDKCTQARSNVQLWPPQVLDLVAGRDCWYQSIRLNYTAGRFVNGSGASVWADTLSPLPSSFNASLAIWVAELQKMFPNYKYGENLFIMGYDWRLDLNSMGSSSQLSQLAAAILSRSSASSRAILMGHSLGALVAAQLLSLPEVRARVKGFISYAGPFGGTATAISPRVSGELASLVPPELLQGITLPIPGIDALVREVTWNGVKGMASLAMLLPYSAAYANGTDPVVVRTASRSYRVSQMAGLLRDVGDTLLADTFNQTHTLDKLITAGPIPGVDVYCMYGVGLQTVRQLVFNVTLSDKIAPLPSAYLYGRGDSVVPFDSLRLCDRLTSGSGKVRRIPGTSGKHLGIMRESSVLAFTKVALEALRQRI
ncbi:hypothetical protein OEZ86_013868 [Tetradesmus obliquus]|nr:hypothetical protein OEZ86_013868 [Tetradesmus obliquus]